MLKVLTTLGALDISQVCSELPRLRGGESVYKLGTSTSAQYPLRAASELDVKVIMSLRTLSIKLLLFPGT